MATYKNTMQLTEAASAADTDYAAIVQGGTTDRSISLAHLKNYFTPVQYTTTEKSKLAGISEGAQANVLESVKLGGTALSITSKSVDIPLDTTATSGSTNPITSGAVYTALGDISTALTTINGE